VPLSWRKLEGEICEGIVRDIFVERGPGNCPGVIGRNVREKMSGRNCRGRHG